MPGGSSHLASGEWPPKNTLNNQGRSNGGWISSPLQLRGHDVVETSRMKLWLHAPGGLVPDLFTYNSSITSCEKALQWQLALELFVCLLKEQRLKVTWIKIKHRFFGEIFRTEFFGTHLEDPGIPSWKLTYPFRFKGTFWVDDDVPIPFRWDMYPFPGGETLGVFYPSHLMRVKDLLSLRKKNLSKSSHSPLSHGVGQKILPIWIARGCI